MNGHKFHNFRILKYALSLKPVKPGNKGNVGKNS